MNEVNTLNIAALVASIVSVIIAIFAIWLSIVFYKMSVANSDAIKESSKDIVSSVDKIEKLFDRLYADTFSMMRDTVSDMRKHMWPKETKTDDKLAEEIKQKTQERFDELKTEVMSTVETRLTPLKDKQSITENEIQDVRNTFSHAIGEAIISSSRIKSEIEEETLREKIQKAIIDGFNSQGEVTAAEVLNAINKTDFDIRSKIIHELFSMKDEGILNFMSPLKPDTDIQYIMG